MSYGFHRLPPNTKPADYIVAEARRQEVIVAIGIEIQGNDVIDRPSNIPGDDQSMPDMSKEVLAEGPSVSDTLLSKEGKDEKIKIARSQGYTGDICVNCHGARLKQAGHCAVCEDCGQTTGCS